MGKWDFVQWLTFVLMVLTAVSCFRNLRDEGGRAWAVLGFCVVLYIPFLRVLGAF